MRRQRWRTKPTIELKTACLDGSEFTESGGDKDEGRRRMGKGDLIYNGS